MTDAEFMLEAISEARLAAAIGEVPIGAVAVVDEKIVARVHNMRETTGNPLGHAEILLLQKLTGTGGDWRLEDLTVYVTCEPCLMCAGAMLQARVKRVVFGCLDPKAGACGSIYNVINDSRLNHQIVCSGGVLSNECGKLLSDFFKNLRSSRT